MKTQKYPLRKKRLSGHGKAVNKKRALAILAGIFVTGFSVYALAGYIGSGEPTVSPDKAIAVLKDPDLTELRNLPADKREEMLKAYGKAISSNFGSRRSSDGNNRREEMRNMRNTIEKLPENEQKAFREGMRSGFQKHREKFQQEMKQKVSDFFKADAETQERLLDEEVERMKKMGEEWKKRRAERDKNKSTADKSKDDKDKRPRFAKRSREDRENHMRERLNEHTPQERAQFQEYFRRIREKMNAKK